MSELIDIHSHLWAEDRLPERWWESLIDIVVRENEKQGNDIARSTIREQYPPTYWDPDAEHLLERMIRSASTDRSCSRSTGDSTLANRQRRLRR